MTMTESKTFRSWSSCRGGEVMRQPGDGVALAAAGGMLNEVLAAGTVGAGIGDEFADGIDLMEAREDESFLADLLAVFSLFGDLEMEKAAEEIHPTVPFPDTLPEVCRLIAVGVFRVAGGRCLG
jgi:hypothetical protein